MKVEKNITTLIKYRSIIDILNEKYKNDFEIKRLKNVFKNEKCVHIPNVFSTAIFKALKTEAHKLTELSIHRNFIMKGYNTPRLMNIVNAKQIIENSELLWTLYSNYHLFNLINKIVGGHLYPSRQPEAFMVLNYLKGKDSTQGWHLDDGSYAVIYAFKTTRTKDGGLLEYIPNWIQLCRKLNVSSATNVHETVAIARELKLVKTLALLEGDCYILKSDTSLHRVTEILTEGAERLVLAVGYESKENTIYTHTGSDLYKFK